MAPRTPEQKRNDRNEARTRSNWAAELGRDDNVMDELIQALDDQDRVAFVNTVKNKLGNDKAAFANDLYDDSVPTHQLGRWDATKPCW